MSDQAPSQVTLHNRSGSEKVTLDADDAVEITNWRARGFATKETWESVEKAEKDAVAADRDYPKWNKERLEAEVERRNDARGDEDQLVVVAEPGNKREIIAALEADDNTQGVTQ